MFYGELDVSDICVAHLVRKKNGLEPFRHFLTSYLELPAGVDHDLLILYKGFYRKSDIAPYEQLLNNIPHSCLMFADFGFDLRPYFVATEKYRSQYFCYLNSWSVIQDKDWLLKLYRHINQPGVGLVGATGWPSVPPALLPPNKNRPLWRRLLMPLVWKLIRYRYGMYYDYAPQYYIRTNGFIIARENMMRIHRGLILTKMHTCRLESGKNSITKQVEKMGLKCLVVGKNGVSYDKKEWHISHTFWSGAQDNLLISDNLTRKFDIASVEDRQEYEFFAWGNVL